MTVGGDDVGDVPFHARLHYQYNFQALKESLVRVQSFRHESIVLMLFPLIVLQIHFLPLTLSAVPSSAIYLVIPFLR